MIKILQHGISLFLVYNMVSCEWKVHHSRKKMSGRYIVDYEWTKAEAFEMTEKETIELVLEENGDFHLESTNSCLNEINGEWKIAENYNLTHIEFTFNGRTQNNNRVYLVLPCFDQPLVLFFKKIEKN